MMYSASIKSNAGGPYFIGFTSGSHDLSVYTNRIAYRNDNFNIILKPAQEKVLRSRKMVPGENGVGVGGRLDFREDFVQGLTASNGNLTKGINHVRQNFDLSGSFETNMNAYYGVGDTELGHVNYYYYYAEADPANNNIYSARLLTQKPRGYKYGLVSSTPKTLNAVFRRDRFGQFRDMLEQRPYTRVFINDPADVRADRQSAGLTPRINQRGLSGVFSRFQQPTWENPTAPQSSLARRPRETSSCNLNNMSTSSMPYFDETLKNRDPVVSDEVEIDVRG